MIVGAQFGTVISMPLSGLLSVSAGGWPSIFYVFGAVGTVWCLAFLYLVHEDPESHKKMDAEERKYIQNALGQKIGVPVRAKFKSLVFNISLTYVLCSLDSPSSLEIHREINAVLGYFIGTHGTQLWL